MPWLWAACVGRACRQSQGAELAERRASWRSRRVLRCTLFALSVDVLPSIRKRRSYRSCASNSIMHSESWHRGGGGGVGGQARALRGRTRRPGRTRSAWSPAVLHLHVLPVLRWRTLVSRARQRTTRCWRRVWPAWRITSWKMLSAPRAALTPPRKAGGGARDRGHRAAATVEGSSARFSRALG